MFRIFVGGGRSASYELSLNLADSSTRKLHNEHVVWAYSLNLGATAVNETENVPAIMETVLFPLSLSVKETHRIKIRGI